METKSKTESVEGFLKSGKDQYEAAVKTGTQAAQKNFEQGVETAKKHLDDVIKNYDDLATFGRENVDACLAASSAATKAAENINSEFFALSKSAYESNVSAYKALSAAKTPKEFFDIQSALMKGRYEESLALANKLSGLMTQATTEAMAPVNARVSATVEKFSKSFA
ncbi:phasin family protein [Govanella unica]|uniref:Phasin family protein n=1 Tax=Govanella unica TaxID=2975056 RepID=A0A9X3TW65_9PROT|nr:phasin family protein [Govania unica]MDA5193100.1 phasin family protein [Govania unica]